MAEFIASARLCKPEESSQSMPMMLGILCGLQSEAKIAQNVPGARVVCAAAQPEKAHFLAHRLVTDGAKRLLSFGVAGGLDPSLPAGSLVIGSSVLSAAGSWTADAEWTASLCAPLPQVRVGTVYASEAIVARATDKRALFEKTKCLCADMESAAVAEAASEARIPFAVLRVIADTAEMDFPPAALIPLKEDGSENLMAVLSAIARQPMQIPDLVRLGLNAGKALRTLRRVVRDLARVRVS